MKIRNLITTTALFTVLSVPATVMAGSGKLAVNITPTIGKVDVVHNGAKMSIMRNQDENNVINSEFANTSRKCPPFCVQPAIVAPGVETIGEVEVLDYLKKIADGDKSLMVVDSRTPDWVIRGTIPGSVNIPWTKLKDDADPFEVADTLTKQFGAAEKGEGFDFSMAKTLVMFCNGTWCGQSPTNIKRLLKMGYPAEKIKWYRGGMQDWEALGLTTVK
ncbi:MAG TPA: rhodanese-like domain-containing protein [Gammaproteobacteria bacterium]